MLIGVAPALNVIQLQLDCIAECLKDGSVGDGKVVSA